MFCKLSIFLCSLVILTCCCSNPSAEEVELAISESKQLQKLDALCASITLPKTAKFCCKRVVIKSSLASVSYYYDYQRDSKNIVKSIEQWLGVNGWQLTRPNNQYSKGNQTITLESASAVENGDVITCGEHF